MRLAAGAAAVLVALVVAGCGGGKSAAPPHRFTFAELVGVIGPVPTEPAGANYLDNAAPAIYGPADLPHGNAAERRTAAAFRRAGLVRIYQRSFNGAANVADITGYLFGSAAGATSVFDLLRTTLSKPEAGSSTKVGVVGAAGLGDEAWAAHLTGDSESSLAVWRRSNVVLVVDMSCDGACGFDVPGAVKGYAGDVDGRAKTVT